MGDAWGWWENAMYLQMYTCRCTVANANLFVVGNLACCLSTPAHHGRGHDLGGTGTKLRQLGKHPRPAN